MTVTAKKKNKWTDSRCWLCGAEVGGAFGDHFCDAERPDYIAPPPNSGCDHVSELQFGRSDHEDTITEYCRETGNTLNDWRRANPNYRMALMNINHDPDVILSDEIGKQHELWHPGLLEDILLNDPDVLVQVMVAARNLMHVQLRPLIAKVSLLFRSSFRTAMFAVWEQDLTVDLLNDWQRNEIKRIRDTWWKSEKLFSEHGAMIVAHWLLELYFKYPDYWISAMPTFADKLPEQELPPGYSRTGARFILGGIGYDEEMAKYSDAIEESLAAVRDTAPTIKFGIE